MDKLLNELKPLLVAWVKREVTLAFDSEEWRKTKNNKAYQINTETGEIVKGNIGQRGCFGTAHSQFSGKPKEAIAHLLKVKEGYVPAAFHKEGLGGIDLPYGVGGENGYGVAHIVERRQSKGVDARAFLDELPTIISEGEIVPHPKTKDRVFIVHEGKRAIIRLDFDGKAKTWLVTAFIDE